MTKSYRLQLVTFILFFFVLMVNILFPGDDIALADNTMRVSVDSIGGEANNISWKPSISADGDLIAFESLATNLVTNDTNSASDIFIHNLKTGTTKRLSVDGNGSQANGNSYEASISGNGLYVAFWSYATNLVTNDTNGWVDVFIKPIDFGFVKIASVNSVTLGP